MLMPPATDVSPLGEPAVPFPTDTSSLTISVDARNTGDAFATQYYDSFDVLHRPHIAFATGPLNEAQQMFYDACCDRPKEELLQHIARFHEASTRRFMPVVNERSTNDVLALSYQSSDASPAVAGFRKQDHLQKAVDDDGSKVFNEHVVLREIGRGSSGKVKLTFNMKTNKLNALKVIPREKPVKLSVQPVIPNSRREVSFLKRLEHPNIVKLHEVIDDPECAKIYLVMQYVDGGHLGQRADPSPPNESVTRYVPVHPTFLTRYARDVLSAVAYMHKVGVAHRDIKPENILVSEDHVAYVADLGVAENFYKKDSTTIFGHVGTLLFMSPSLLEKNPTCDGFANDMWAVGVTLYAALTGSLPFATTDDIMHSDETLRLPTEFGPSWFKLLKRLLCRDQEKRWTAKRALKFVNTEMLANEAFHSTMLSSSFGFPSQHSTVRSTSLPSGATDSPRRDEGAESVPSDGTASPHRGMSESVSVVATDEPATAVRSDQHDSTDDVTPLGVRPPVMPRPPRNGAALRGQNHHAQAE